MIGDQLPLPVPRPTRIAEPVLGYRARFYAHPLLPGVPVSRAALDDGALARMAAPLGRFLAALHAAPLPRLRAAGLRDDDRGGASRSPRAAALASAPIDDPGCGRAPPRCSTALATGAGATDADRTATCTPATCSSTTTARSPA